MRTTDGYTTPEGFWLARPLLLPDVRDFAELATYVREWDFATMNHRAGTIPRPDLVPDPVLVDRLRPKGNTISPYCRLSLKAVGGPDYRGIAIAATDLVVETVRSRIVTPDDRLSLEVIGHADRNRALVILQHNYIIGSHWLAYVDPATIPEPENEPAIP